jgi:hypothetical protein
MADELKPNKTEYILVTDKTSEVISAATGNDGKAELTRLYRLIVKAGGEVTLFQSVQVSIL